MEYCIIDMKRSKEIGAIVFWKANGNGYTLYWDEAGKYSERESLLAVESDTTSDTIRIEWGYFLQQLNLFKTTKDGDDCGGIR